jgi:predicted membrane protein
MSTRGRDLQGGVVGGTVVVIVGTLFLLDNMGVISASHLARFWPLILVISGFAALMTAQGRVKGVILIVLGILFQLDSLGIAHFHWSSLWPLAMIGAGLVVIWSTLEMRRTGFATGDSRNNLNEFALFGGVERRITSQDFKGGVATAIFGGIEIDLRQAVIADDRAELNINAVFGGCEIRVPENWEVIAHGQGIFGGYVDSTKSWGGQPPESAGGIPRKPLYIRGVAVFGGVEIKN